MAEQLDLAIVLKAILDAKGFEDAQKAIKGLKDRANEAAGPLGNAGAAGKKMGESFGGTRGPIADLTRVLLVNIGISGQAGVAAKAAGTAMYFLEGAVTGTTVAMAGATLGLSLLIPLIIRWATSTDDQAVTQKELKEEIVKTLPFLKQYAEQARVIAESTRLQLALERNKSFREEREELKELNAGEARRLMLLEAIGKRSAADQAFFDANRDEIQKDRGRLMDLQEAQRAGITVEELYARRIKVEAEAHTAAAEATKNREQAQKDLNAAIEEGRLGQAEIAAKERQRLLDKDSKALADREKTGKHGKLSPELFKRLTEFDIEKKGLKDLADYDAETKRLRLQGEREYSAAMAGAIGQSLGAMSALFGGNKELAIAGAIADTYAGATKALAIYGPTPLGYTVMAATIITGLANVANIRKATPVGFDDPFSDLLAEKLGRKSAADFVRHFGIGFQGSMAGGGSNGTTNVYHQTTINRGTSIGTMRMPGYLGAGRTEFWKHARREMERVGGRLEGRTTLGRTGR